MSQIVRDAVWLGARTSLCVVAACLCIGTTAPWLLNALAPAQRAVFAFLMPEHAVREFGPQRVGAHMKLRERSSNIEHLVIRGRVYPPGIAFEAETPARTALVYSALIVAGAALTIRGSKKTVVAASSAALLAALKMAVVAPSVLLAGAHWSVALAPFEEMSMPATLVGISEFLIHGGGYALCAAAVWSAASIGRQL